MSDQRDLRKQVVSAILVAFGLGAIFGALGTRKGGASRVALAPGHPDGSDEERGLTATAGDSSSGTGSPS